MAAPHHLNEAIDYSIDGFAIDLHPNFPIDSPFTCVKEQIESPRDSLFTDLVAPCNWSETAGWFIDSLPLSLPLPSLPRFADNTRRPVSRQRIYDWCARDSGHEVETTCFPIEGRGCWYRKVFPLVDSRGNIGRRPGGFSWSCLRTRPLLSNKMEVNVW